MNVARPRWIPVSHHLGSFQYFGSVATSRLTVIVSTRATLAGSSYECGSGSGNGCHHADLSSHPRGTIMTSGFHSLLVLGFWQQRQEHITLYQPSARCRRACRGIWTRQGTSERRAIHLSMLPIDLELTNVVVRLRSIQVTDHTADDTNPDRVEKDDEVDPPVDDHI
jgi:hypothetical protein